MAFVCPSLSWISAAPAEAIAVRTLSRDEEYLSSIAMPCLPPAGAALLD
jgi:hypothetical protein